MKAPRHDRADELENDRGSSSALEGPLGVGLGWKL
jgi:hypothetical protein